MTDIRKLAAARMKAEISKGKSFSEVVQVVVAMLRNQALADEPEADRKDQHSLFDAR